MGTRSLTVVMSMWFRDDIIQAAIFRHWDGYPSGHGADLANYLKDGCVGNGKTTGDPEKYFNGMNRLASYVIHRMWEDGHDPGVERVVDNKIPDWGQDYTYIIRAEETKPKDAPAFWGPKKETENFTIEVRGYRDTPIFVGTPTELLDWISKGAPEEDDG
jgi:hypothetical protein